MHSRIIYIILISSLYSSTNLIEPILFTEYSSSGKDWITSKRTITAFGAGFKFFYKGNNFTITSKYIQFGFLGDIDTSMYSLTSRQSLPYIDKSKDADGYWSEFSEAKISYSGDNYIVNIGKYDNKWGYGINSIHISNKTPSYPQIGFNWNIKKNLKLHYFHGFLISGIIDSSYNNYYNNNGDNLGRSIDVKRSIAGHRLEWIVNKKLKLSLNETVIYAFRGLDFNYLVPIIPFYPIENYLGDTDNLQMGFDLEFKASEYQTMYLSFFMDELTPEWLFRSKNHNWFAWQIGYYSKKILNENLIWGFEYNWTDQRIYKHKFKVNNFYSHNQPLGFWAGPHAQELIFFANKNLGDKEIEIKITTLMRGLNEKSSILNNYKDIHLPRFDPSIIVEEKVIRSIYLTKHFNKIFSYKITISNIDFENINTPESELRTSLNKTSIELGLFYNIDIGG